MIKFRNYTEYDYKNLRNNLELAGFFNKIWDSKENLAGMIHNFPEAIVIAFDDTKGKEEDILGSAYIIPFGSKVAYIFRLIVNTDHRNEGVGTALINHIESILKSKGYKEIGIYVNAMNKNLQEYYKKKGFQTTDRPWIYMFKGL